MCKRRELNINLKEEREKKRIKWKNCVRIVAVVSDPRARLLLCFSRQRDAATHYLFAVVVWCPLNSNFVHEPCSEEEDYDDCDDCDDIDATPNKIQ